MARADEVQLLCIANQRHALRTADCKPLQVGHNDTYLVVEPAVRKVSDALRRVVGDVDVELAALEM